jgi:glucose-6-phosphate 1-dehydrogenase
MQLGQVGLNLSLGDKFTQTRRRIAYERMLIDVLAGNPSLFVRRDEVEAAWKWIDSIVAGWQQTGQKPRPYGAGSWGPSAAIGLPERFGHSWSE